MEFKNKVVIVTGGAQGIGKAVSIAFGKKGAKVVIGDMDEEAGREQLTNLEDNNIEAIFVKMDVSIEDDVKNIVKKTIEKFHNIDILINNAGIATGGNIFTRPMEEWDRVIGVNLTGPYMMAKYCGPELMKGEQGIIINISSTRALMSEADTEPYSASKGGLLALTHSLAVSMGPKVRVNAISPGWIECGDWQKKSKCTMPTHRPEDIDQHPAGMIGTPEDIANTCLFLASSDSRFITGSNIVVDGGMTTKMIYVE